MYFIAFKYPSGVLAFITDDDENVATWGTEEEAQAFANDLPIFKCGQCSYQIYEWEG